MCATPAASRVLHCGSPRTARDRFSQQPNRWLNDARTSHIPRGAELAKSSVAVPLTTTMTMGIIRATRWSSHVSSQGCLSGSRSIVLTNNGYSCRLNMRAAVGMWSFLVIVDSDSGNVEPNADLAGQWLRLRGVSNSFVSALPNCNDLIMVLVSKFLGKFQLSSARSYPLIVALCALVPCVRTVSYIIVLSSNSNRIWRDDETSNRARLRPTAEREAAMHGASVEFLC